MPSETFIVAYEGEGRSVVDFAVSRARLSGARLHLVHVLEWSPYSFLTPEELAERHARRKEELARAHAAVLDPVLADLKAAGVEATGEIRYGAVVDLIVGIAKKQQASMIFAGRTGGSSMTARFFGSVSIGLAQTSPVPIVIVP